MPKLTKPTLWATLVVLVALLTAIALPVYDQKIGIGAPSHPAFLGYEPTVLPTGIHPTGQTLTRYRQKGFDAWYFIYEVKLNNPAFVFTVQKIGDSEPKVASCKTSLDTCNIYRASNGMAYRVIYTHYKQPTRLEVDWTNGNADCSLVINGDLATDYLNYDWSPVVSGAQPVNLSKVPFTQQTVGDQYGA